MAALLLVDDDPPIRRMLERTLAAEGYDVEAAADGGAALAAVERSVPDAIVLDVTHAGARRARGHAPAAREGPARADPAADRARRRPRAGRRPRRRRRRLPGQAVRRRRAERAGAGAAAAQRAAPARRSRSPTSTLEAGIGAPRRPRPRAHAAARPSCWSCCCATRAASSPASSRSTRCGAARATLERRRPLRRLPAPQARRPAADPHRARRRVPARSRVTPPGPRRRRRRGRDRARAWRCW